MAKKKSNKQLGFMLALIVVLAAVIIWLPTGEKSSEKEQKEQKEDPEIEATTHVKAGDKAPDFRVEMFDGATVSLSDLGGKVVLLNFWATWCSPCRQELTRVQTELIDRFAGRNFVFLPVSRGETRETVEAFRRQTGYTFPMGLDPQQDIFAKYASNFIPRNFLIGADGKVILSTAGYEEGEFDSLLQTIEATLEATTNQKPE